MSKEVKFPPIKAANPIPVKFRQFACLSAFSFIMQLAGTAFFHEIMGIREEAAYGMTLALVFLVNFSVMRYWIYKGSRRNRAFASQFFLTVITSVIFRIIEFCIFLVLFHQFGLYYLLAIGIGISLSFLLKFLVYHFIVFPE